MPRPSRVLLSSVKHLVSSNSLAPTQPPEAVSGTHGRFPSRSRRTQPPPCPTKPAGCSSCSTLPVKNVLLSTRGWAAGSERRMIGKLSTLESARLSCVVFRSSTQGPSLALEQGGRLTIISMREGQKTPNGWLTPRHQQQPGWGPGPGAKSPAAASPWRLSRSAPAGSWSRRRGPRRGSHVQPWSPAPCNLSRRGQPRAACRRPGGSGSRARTLTSGAAPAAAHGSACS